MGGRDRPRLGIALSDGTNRNQAQILILTAALQTAGRRARQVYTSGGGWHATTLKPGRAWQPYRRRVLLLGRRGGWPMGAEGPERKTLHPCPNPAGILPTHQGGARLSHCEATNPRRQRHHRPAGRRAKRALADHFTGQSRSAMHREPMLTGWTSSAVRRVTVRGRGPGRCVLVCRLPTLQCWLPGRIEDYSHLSLFGSRHTWRVLMTTGRPHGQGRVVSPPKVVLAAQAWPSDPKHFAGDLGNLAALAVTLKLEMPISSHMYCFLAFDGSRGGKNGDSRDVRMRPGTLIRLPHV